MLDIMSNEPQLVKDALQLLVGSLNPDQQSLFNRQPSTSSVTSPQSLNSDNISAAASIKSFNMKARKNSVDIQKAMRIRDRQIVSERRKKKKPLNAFIAFRGKYLHLT